MKYICQRNCKDYIFGIIELESAVISLERQGVKYTGNRFKYCPWCGSALVLNPDYEEQAGGLSLDTQ